MKKRNALILALIVLGLFFFASPVSAGIKDIPAGGTVFIGEQGLDISGITGAAAVDLGWWASGAVIDTTSADSIINVPDPKNFYVTPSVYTGTWYKLPAKTPVFNVAAPQLDIKVEDTTVNVDVTDKWVPTDDELQFRIETNLVPISQRGGGNPITIKVQSPNGAVYTSLVDNAGNPTSIVDYPITSTPQSTGSIWGTANRALYPPGTYTIWAESNVNSPSVPLCASRKISLLNQDQNPLIVNKGYVTNPSTQITLVSTTKIITTAPTTAPTTLQTPPPTIAVPTILPETTVAVTEIPTTPLPTPTPTKSPGFEASIVVVAWIFGLVLFLKKQ
ncbi:MAG: DUF3821 domain-containing protein [Methanoregula sp.]|nr:DUF3821 domain-containing protein [Methanoregula sp.]